MCFPISTRIFSRCFSSLASSASRRFFAFLTISSAAALASSGVSLGLIELFGTSSGVSRSASPSCSSSHAIAWSTPPPLPCSARTALLREKPMSCRLPSATGGTSGSTISSVPSAASAAPAAAVASGPGPGPGSGAAFAFAAAAAAGGPSPAPASGMGASPGAPSSAKGQGRVQAPRHRCPASLSAPCVQGRAKRDLQSPRRRGKEAQKVSRRWIDVGVDRHR